MKHKNVASSASKGSAQVMTRYLQANPDPLEDKIKYAEVKLAGYIAAHNEAFLKLDHLIEVLKDIFDDSEICKGMSLKRTKGKGVVINVLGKEHLEVLTAKLKEYKFSVLTDESTDISAVKTSCVLVMYYDEEEGGIVTDFWDLHQLFSDNDPDGAEVGATAHRLF